MESRRIEDKQTETWEGLSVEEAVGIQESLRSRICQKSSGKKIQTVAGVDLAYWKEEDRERAVCCIVVLDADTKKVVESTYLVGDIKVPYIPGCLAFRELPLVLKTVKQLQMSPDLYMFDGNGYLHPRHMGIATHAAFYLEKPTIGVAKSYYKVGDTEYEEPENDDGAFTDIVVDGEVYGRTLRTHKNVKPVFISVGNGIDLEEATKIVCNFVTKESHIPLPTRLADIETHKRRREAQTSQ